MRLLCTIKNESQGQAFAGFLTSQGIQNHVDTATVTDWGSEHYGDREVRIWVIEEDQVEPAKEFYKEFAANPSDPRFEATHTTLKTLLEPGQSKEAAREKLVKIQQAASKWQAQSIGLVTLYLLLTCTLLFVWGVMSLPRGIAQIPDGPVALLQLSPVNQALMYDYPHKYEIYDRLIRLYQTEALAQADNEKKSETTLPVEAEVLLDQFSQTPVWTGLYDKLVLFLQGRKEEISWDQPLFEKIHQGQIWRIFTPSLLHSDIIHLFFNMIWLLVLGKQMESRMGIGKYLLFILITAGVSNTAQYLVSGANFLGISGVIAAMLGFIYVRQKEAPWEGYQLHRATLLFLAFFILAMLGVQIASFGAEVLWQMPLAPRIANTAHLAGIAAGYFLAKWNFFSWQTTPTLP